MQHVDTVNYCQRSFLTSVSDLLQSEDASRVELITKSRGHSSPRGSVKLLIAQHFRLKLLHGKGSTVFG